MRPPLQFASLAMLGSTLLGCAGEPAESPSGDLRQAPEVVMEAFDLGEAEPYLPARLAALSGRRLAINDGVDPPFIRIHDSTGAMLRRLGHRGQGPGELQGGEAMWGAGDSLTVIRADAVVRFAASGDGFDTHRISRPEVIVGLHADSLDGYPDRQPAVDGPGRGIARRAIGDSSWRVVVPADDSVVVLAREGTPRGAAIPGAWIAGPSRGYFGDGWSYTIGIYDPAGRPLGRIHRELPPNHRSARRIATMREAMAAALQAPRGLMPARREIEARADTLDREVIPHFEQGMLRLDGRGRLWVFGHLGDRTFADIYTDGRFAGRRLLACAYPRGRIAMGGDWFAMQCERTDGEPGRPYRVRIWRIIEPAPATSPAS